MQVTVPLFVHSDRPKGQRALYSVRPLLFSGFEARNPNLGKATARCVSRLRRQMNTMCQQGDFRDVVRQTFSPECNVHRYRFEIPLKTSYVREQVIVVSFRAMGRTVAFLPALSTFWFELRKGQSVSSRAKEVLSEFLLGMEKESREDLDHWVQQIRSRGRSWVTTINFDIDTKRETTSLRADLASFFSGNSVSDGATELENVGRCLDVLYPDNLMRCVQRNDLVESLKTLLTHEDLRPVMLVGRRLVGKTSLIHEVICRTRNQQGEHFQSQSNTWLLSPQRLISGMSFVGQWENRLLAILQHARKKKHTLYFDDLVGLYRAGVSRDSDLNVAQVLKPWIERRDVRVLAEITPERLRVLREQDRAFADLFHIVRIDEPTEEAAIRMLLSVVRELEDQTCEFEPNVIPAVMDLCRRFYNDAAFPGTAAEMLRGLAARRAGRNVDRTDVMGEFSRRSGLRIRFIDQSQRLSSERVMFGLRQGIVGQNEAVAAIADRIYLSRARLNDPSRPLGSFLFAGPTGVGKTQCARALASYLYGDEDRMVRFDMNEFISHHAAAQLVGTFRSPEGLLTSAVRRQPFSVVLLDEIEKAHPDVFDLLLQVLGEGRLTDANGNTVDFTNTFVILTSNLGSSDAAGVSGFGESSPREGAYMQAVERFFRPEFVNRLDRIIPFRPLNEEQIHKITTRLIEAVSLREGFARRRCIMHPQPGVVDLVVKRGFEPRWGARGVRREIERSILQPISAQLAKATHGNPTVVEIDARKGKVVAQVQPLEDVERATGTLVDVDTSDRDELLDKVRRFLNRAKETCQQFRPASELTAGSIQNDYFHYLNVTELIRELETVVSQLGQTVASSPDFSDTLITRARKSRSSIWRSYNLDPSRKIMGEFAAADDILEFMADVGQSTVIDQSAALPRLLRNIGILNHLLPKSDDWQDERVIILFRALQSQTFATQHSLMRLYETRMTDGLVRDEEDAWSLGYEFASSHLVLRQSVRETNGNPAIRNSNKQALARYREETERMREHHCEWIQVEGCKAKSLLRYDQGTHLMISGARIQPIQMIVESMLPDEDSFAAVNRILDQAESSDSDQISISDPANPFVLRPVIRLYEGSKNILDLRTGMKSDEFNTAPMLFYSLPMPEELLS